MATDRLVDVMGIVHRLGNLLPEAAALAATVAAMTSPVAFLVLYEEVMSISHDPPPGDPNGLLTLAAAFRSAAADIDSIGQDVAKIGTDHLPSVWHDGAGQDAAAVVKATSAAVNRTPATFSAAATELVALSGEIADQQRRWSTLRLPFPDLILNPQEIIGVINGLIRVYEAAAASAARAGTTFAELKSRARAGAAVGGGLSAADAILFADKTLSGNGDPATDGILSATQLAAISKLLAAMSPADRARFNDLLSRAGSDTERAWLLKGLAAGHNVTELSGFADQIRGQSDQWLRDHLSLVDPGNGNSQGLFSGKVLENAADNTTCGPTALIVARAQSDPLYALSLTGGDPNTFQQRFYAEQARVHDETNQWPPWPQSAGTLPMAMSDWMNNHSGQPGVTYNWHPVDDTDPSNMASTYNDVVTAVDAGHPVPVMVGDGDVPRHYVLVLAHSGDSLSVYDPSDGQVNQLSDRDFLNSNLGTDAGNWTRVHGVITPNH